MTNEQAHKVAREKGVSRPLYALVRVLIVPWFRLWFRMRISGVEHIPREGAAIVAPNHKSFWDSFFIGVCTKRHLRFMAKTELIETRYGWLLVRLGAFPVRRGKSDADAIETARTILRQGGLFALFPEGTRVPDPEALGSPRRGVGRLALETGASIVPAAISGSESLFWGPLPRPRRVQVAFAEPIHVEEREPTPDAAAALVRELVWPEVETEYSRLRSRPGLIAAAIAALGIGGGLLARRQRTAKPSGLGRVVPRAGRRSRGGGPLRRRRKRSRLPWKR